MMKLDDAKDKGIGEEVVKIEDFVVVSKVKAEKITKKTR